VKFGFLDLQKKNVFLTTSAADTVAQVAATTLDTFKKKPLELRDKQVVDVDPSSIKSLTIETHLPATTQPTTRPASDSTIVLAHRPPPTSAPATEPATQPTTVASSQPATKPAPQSAPLSKWIITSTTQPTDATDTRVTAILNALHPLKVDKYLESPEASAQPQDHYVLTLASAPPLMANYRIELIDPGNAKPLIGSYNGLTFELDRTLLDKLKADFTKPDTSSTDESLPTNPSINPGAFPPGAFPAGQ
jgi:hypothetical protein